MRLRNIAIVVFLALASSPVLAQAVADTKPVAEQAGPEKAPRAGRAKNHAQTCGEEAGGAEARCRNRQSL